MFRMLPFDMSMLNLLMPAPIGMIGLLGPETAQPSVAAYTQTSVGSAASLASAYASLATATRQRMQALNAEQCSVPECYANRESKNAKFNLQAQAWRICVAGQRVAELRLVKIDGAKSNIINAWIFPCLPNHLPVYAAELIGVSDVTRVAFVDLQTASRDISLRSSVERTTAAIAKRFAALPCDELAPEWATSESAGHFTYSRNAHAQHLPLICACYLEYLDCYLSQFIACFKPHTAEWSSTANQAAIAQLHEYQLHHMEHSPGKKFLGNLFEVAWTEKFMLEFLFAKPQG